MSAPAAKEAPKQSAAVEVNNAEALLYNDELVDMLQLLDYETQFCDKELKPMSRTYFVYAAANTSQQFKYFNLLVVWCLGKVRVEANWGKYDDPTTICTNMLIALKEVGVQVDVSPGKLKQGSGDGVCAVLHSLVKEILRRSGFEYGTPTYPDEGLADEAEVDSDAEIQSVGEDEMPGADGEEDDLMYQETKKDDGDKSDDGEHGILEADIDPKEWLLEVERVAPKLKIQMPSDSKEWRTHLQQTKGYKDVIEGQFPAAKQQLDKLAKELSTSLERIRTKEQFINNQFEGRALDYRSQQDELQQVQQQYTELNEIVMNLQADQKAITEELDVVKSEMEERSSTVTDTAPIVKMKDAFKRLRIDTRQLEVRIGVVSHTLMQAKLRQRPQENKALYPGGAPGGDADQYDAEA